MAWCIMNFCHKVVCLIRNAAPLSAKQFVRNVQNYGKTSQGFYTNDNAPAHTLMLAHEFLAEKKTVIMSQPSYTPKLTPAALFIFPKLKSAIKRKHFDMIEEIKEK